jgi:hypothetical protein
MEGRGLAKGNPSQQNAPRAQHRDGARSALERVREVAERDKTVRFTTLLHHVYNIEHLRAAYYALKRGAAPGIDGETWGHYGEALEANLADLAGRLKRGAYRAKPVKRTYIPKADGRQRPLGIPTITAYCGGVPHLFRLGHRGASISSAGRPTIAYPLRAAAGRRSGLHL